MNDVFHGAFAGALEVFENRAGISCEHWLDIVHILDFHRDKVAHSMRRFGSGDHAGHELANQIIVGHLAKNHNYLKYKFLTRRVTCPAKSAKRSFSLKIKIQ